MQVICPHCSTENKIEYSKNIICNKCKTSFSGHTYKSFKKPLASAATALVIGAIGAYEIDKRFIDETRYPVRVEYELIDACVNLSRVPLTSRQRVKKVKICICALENTMKNVSFKDMQKSESKFVTRFRTSIASCS